MRVRWGGRTDVGKSRANNEDQILTSSPLFLVADGMGGHAAGDVASRLAVAAFDDLPREDLLLRDLVRATRDANQRIRDHVADEPAREGMGTTISGFALLEGKAGPYAAIINVGDSRTYLFRDGELRQLTVDHSVVQELVDAGEITPEEAESHPHRHVVTRALGADDDVEVDTSTVPLRVGDRLLVCSDGLSSVVVPDELHAAMAHRDKAERVANLLIELALDHGAPDNVSVIVVDIEATDDRMAFLDIDVDTIPGLRIPSRRR